MAEPDERADRRLRQIADMLGIPVARLFDADATMWLADTEECLRLWRMLKTDAGRADALEALRRVLHAERG